jgi:hypothetical protein
MRGLRRERSESHRAYHREGFLSWLGWSQMTVSRRSLLAGVAGAPLAKLVLHDPSRRAAIARPRVIGVSPQGDVGWVDAVTREALVGPRWPLDGWWALAVSLDRRAVLLRRFYTEPFLLATADTQRFRQSKAFSEGVSSVKGGRAGLAERTPADGREGRGLRLRERPDSDRDRQSDQGPGQLEPQHRGPPRRRGQRPTRDRTGTVAQSRR